MINNMFHIKLDMHCDDLFLYRSLQIKNKSAMMSQTQEKLTTNHNLSEFIHSEGSEICAPASKDHQKSNKDDGLNPEKINEEELPYTPQLYSTTPVIHPQYDLELETIHRRRRNISLPAEYHEITTEEIPYIFYANYAFIRRMALSSTIQNHARAAQVFNYLKNKLASRKGYFDLRFDNRMKDEQKIKFILRAYEHPNDPKRKKGKDNDNDNKFEKFNQQSQIKFFNRQDVKKSYHQKIRLALERKRKDNDIRVQQFVTIVKAILHPSISDTISNQIFTKYLKKKQLPWIIDMFTDIERFSKILYKKYVENAQYLKKQTIQRRIYGRTSTFKKRSDIQTVQTAQSKAVLPENAFQQIDIIDFYEE